MGRLGWGRRVGGWGRRWLRWSVRVWLLWYEVVVGLGWVRVMGVVTTLYRQSSESVVSLTS